MRRVIIVMAAAALSLGAAACSSDETTPAGGGTTDPGGPADGTLTIAGTAFDPATVTIAEGGTIAITNQDGFAHTFTMDDDSVSVDMPGGATETVTIATAGGFHCEIHSSMSGTVVFG